MTGRRRASIAALETERAAHHVYSSRWADLRAQGARPVVINRRANPEAWAAWYAYFRAKGLTMLVEMMDDKPDRTVPTMWPADFDLDVQPGIVDRRVKD